MIDSPSRIKNRIKEHGDHWKVDRRFSAPNLIFMRCPESCGWFGWIPWIAVKEKFPKLLDTPG